MMNEKIIEVKGLYKFYKAGETVVHALDGLDFTINKGEFVAIVGPSGSGKSTLLNMLAGLEKPTKGEIIINGKHLQNGNAMSGGQQQRVGIARALAMQPKIIFADEPTGNLDTKTSAEVLELMKHIVKEENQTLIMVTHDNDIAKVADRQIRIVDGKAV